MTSKSGRDYDVGYGKPPKSKQFQKGQSGNPKGRKKGSKNYLTDLEAELEEKITIIENGERKTLPKRAAMIRATVHKAIKGDMRALHIILNELRPSRPSTEPRNEETLLDLEKSILDEYVQRRSRPAGDGGDDG